MTACAGIVNYRFCPRLLEKNQNISTADQLIDEYNGMYASGSGAAAQHAPPLRSDVLLTLPPHAISGSPRLLRHHKVGKGR